MDDNANEIFEAHELEVVLTGAVDGEDSDQDALSDDEGHATVWDVGKGVLGKEVEVRIINL